MKLTETSWWPALELEHQVAEIIRQQEIYGWQFDTEAAKRLLQSLDEQLLAMDTELLRSLPRKQIKFDNPTIDRPFTKQGLLSVRVENWLQEQSQYCKGPFSKVASEPFNLNSDVQLKEYFASVGWEPDEWNFNKETKERTSPKLTESSLSKLEDPLAKVVSHRLTMTHRRSQIQGLLDNVRPDGRIEARANTIGTNTMRFTHSVVVNIPKAKPQIYLGTEMRSLFIAPEGKILVGCDAKGLQARMLAHYMNDPELTTILTVGDIHTRIWDTIREYCESRDHSKNFFYALVFGALDDKLGRMADFNPKKLSTKVLGLTIRSNIMAGLPALAKLIEGVTQAARTRGYLFGLDRRKIWIRSPHSAFNALLQAAEAVVMKRAMVLCHQYFKEHGLRSFQVGHMHDEQVCEAFPEEAELTKKLMEDSIVNAGLYYKLNCPLEGDGKVGKDWSIIH